MAELCYWCHEPLSPLPADASYVDEINHYAHEACLEERDERNRRMDQLRTGIADGSIDSIPDVVRRAVLDRIKTSGFSVGARACTTRSTASRATSRTRTPVMKPKSTTTTSATA